MTLTFTRLLPFIFALSLLSLSANALADSEADYWSTVSSAIREHWSPNKERVLVWLTVDDTGKLAAVRAFIPSADKKANDDALDAVRKAAPFLPPPKGTIKSFTLGFIDGTVGGTPLVVGDIAEAPPASAQVIQDFQLRGKTKLVDSGCQFLNAIGQTITQDSVPAEIRIIAQQNWTHSRKGLFVAQVDTSVSGHENIVGTERGKGWTTGTWVNHLDHSIIYSGGARNSQLPTSLEVRKMGYKDLLFPIPANFGPNKIAWLGKRSLSKYSGPTARVKGTVRDPQKKLFTVSGRVSLYVPGTKDRLIATLQNGTFHFDAVPPGEYEIEFQLNHFAVARWGGSISPPVVSRDFIAVPSKHLTFRTPDGHQEEIELPGNYAKTQIHNIYMDQIGFEIHFSTDGSSVIIVKRSDGSSDDATAARTDWYGTLKAGDDIVLLNYATRKFVSDLKVVAVR